MIKAVKDYPDYKVTDDGQVIGKRGKVMIGHVDKCGYLEVLFSYYPKSFQMRVHRLVAEAFISNPNNLPCVNHKDGNKLNNCVSNLEWCTHSENTIHAYETGLEKKVLGENHHAHKLTNDAVKYIKSVYIKRHSEFGATALAKKFKVDRTTISDVIRNKTWKECCCD